MKYLLKTTAVATLIAASLVSVSANAEVLNVDDYPAFITGVSEVSVRYGPSTDSKRAGFLKASDSVLVVAHVNGWRQIKTSESDTALFVWSDFVAGHQLAVEPESLKIRNFSPDHAMEDTQVVSVFSEDEGQPLLNKEKVWGVAELTVNAAVAAGSLTSEVAAALLLIKSIKKLVVDNDSTVLEEADELIPTEHTE